MLAEEEWLPAVCRPVELKGALTAASPALLMAALRSAGHYASYFPSCNFQVDVPPTSNTLVWRREASQGSGGGLSLPPLLASGLFFFFKAEPQTRSLTEWQAGRGGASGNRCHLPINWGKKERKEEKKKRNIFYDSLRCTSTTNCISHNGCRYCEPQSDDRWIDCTLSMRYIDIDF